ncbi:MAG: cell division protein ZipA [Gammaproteobacteria bacterium]|nr:cell division protein ZipA [Gammaproteobacteria bacterium]
MDSTVLRLILLVLGILALLGIYLWETRRRQRSSAQAKPREAPEFKAVPELDDTPDPSAWTQRDDEVDDLASELAELSDEVKSSVTEQNAMIDLQSTADSTTASVLAEQQEMFGFSANEESPLDVPDKIIQINIKTKGEPFSGDAIQAAVREVGLQPGEMQIYHRYTTDGRQKTVFNMASMVEPGVFPLKEMTDYATPGLTLFAQLPAPGDSLAIFSDMLFTAERLAARLGGVLQDETHSTLTKQTIETLRSEIVEHRRLVQLARSRR